MAISRNCVCGNLVKQGSYNQKLYYKSKVYTYVRPYYYCSKCTNNWRKEHLSIARLACRIGQGKKALVIREAKDKPCVDCGIKYPYYCMDFDHLRDKQWNIGQDYTRIGIEVLKNEIKKCEVVCSNCHRKRTYERLHKKEAENGTI